jgi:type VI secretion system ImpH/TssG family protein
VAAKTGPATEHLSFFREAKENIKRYGFFALIRAAEARAPGLPRLGMARLPNLNIADLAQSPGMDFPGSTLEDIEVAPHGRVRVRGRFLGLTGPMGALPLHLTEYAAYERRYATSHPFGRFLDLLTDRMLQFFYRAWADSQPAAQADRPMDDRFAGYLSALSGARDGGSGATAFDQVRRLHYVGLFASRRNPAVIQDGLSHVLKMPVRIKEFVGSWRDIEQEDRSRLQADGGYNELGLNTVLGRRVRMAEDKFRVIVKMPTSESYESMLPGGENFALAREAITALAPSHLDWDIELEINERDAPPARLDGRSRLGWVAWLGAPGRDVIRAEARLGRSSRTA